jgi:hypothetical protein
VKRGSERASGGGKGPGPIAQRVLRHAIVAGDQAASTAIRDRNTRTRRRLNGIASKRIFASDPTGRAQRNQPIPTRASFHLHTVIRSAIKSIGRVTRAGPTIATARLAGGLKARRVVTGLATIAVATIARVMIGLAMIGRAEKTVGAGRAVMRVSPEGGDPKGHREVIGRHTIATVVTGVIALARIGPGEKTAAAGSHATSVNREAGGLKDGLGPIGRRQIATVATGAIGQDQIANAANGGQSLTTRATVRRARGGSHRARNRIRQVQKVEALDLRSINRALVNRGDQSLPARADGKAEERGLSRADPAGHPAPADLHMDLRDHAVPEGLAGRVSPETRSSL